MVTISLMVLLTVVAVGLLSLSGVALRSASQGEAMATARANARMALLLAIGELQKSLGPDKAITATSGILAASLAKPGLTGVWKSWDFNPNTGAPDYATEKKSRFRGWMVSNADLTALLSPDFATSKWSGDTIELVGDAALGGNADASAKVVAGKVPVVRDGKAQGAYAWHVADESVKARVNLYRDPDQNKTLAQKRALLAGQRPDPSVMKSPVGGTLGFLPADNDAEAYEKATATTGKVTDLAQAELLDNATGKIKPFRNDLTPYSMGLMVDVRHGGLKQDLSSVFETSATSAANLPAEFRDQRLYQSMIGITGVSDPYWSSLSGYYNIFRNLTQPDSSPTFSQAPAQDTLITNLAPTTAYCPGPVIAKVEVLFSYVTRDAHGSWYGDLQAVDPTLLYMGHLMYTPLITLHNPYNVSLSFDNLLVIIRNVPVAFRFYVNGLAQNSCLVPLCEMYVDGPNRAEKSFALNIGNWSAPGNSSTTGPLVMKPGQTLICGPYVDPASTFPDNWASFFDFQNNMTGYKVQNGTTTITPIKAKPGFAGRCVGFDIDWLTPLHTVPSLGSLAPPATNSTDGGVLILGLRASDTLHLEYAVQQPTLGLNTAFEVTARLNAKNKTVDYGGLSFQYQDAATLGKFFNNTTYRYPPTGELTASQTYASKTDPVSQHALAKTVAVFSAYARTTNGGVYETNKRTPTGGALNVLRDGRLAGKPFLFHNPARTVCTMDLKSEKPGAHSHELNFQPLPGNVDDLFEIDPLNRCNYLTANTTLKGIKSGSYLELPSGPLQTIADFRRSNALTSSYLPNFVQPVGNSLVSPLMSTDKVSQNDAGIAGYTLLDHSVLANHALYDRFYFSTFATRGSATPEAVFGDFMEGKTPLPSQAFQPHLPVGKTVATAKAELFQSGKPKDNAYQLAAEYQMIRGPFNVNSTSVQAWKAMLASFNKSEVITLWAKTTGLETTKAAGAAVLPMSLVNGGVVGGAADFNKIDNARTNEWNGCRVLTEYELEELAARIVEQVRARGPFLSMSEFVNRRIGADSELTRGGALETALGHAKTNDKVFTTLVPIAAADLCNADFYNYKTPLVAVGNPAAGAPGWINQGDLMRMLEPAATVRSDTFVIRTCGEAWDTAGKVIARAYAEAVVQRFPEYVDPADRPSVNVDSATSAGQTNRNFGRSLRVISFRWLSSKEI